MRNLMTVLLTQYFSGDKIEQYEMGGACSADWERRCAYGVLVEIREGKRPFGRPRHRVEGNIQTDLQKVEWRHGLD
jgi:hypothetical protein